MTITRPYLEELLSRLRLSQVVQRRVQLKRAGKEFSGLCPFHHEKSPSFTVNDDKGFYHCFGCGAHGDAVRFVMETEGMTYPETVERLAAEAGMAPPPKSGKHAGAEQKARDEKATLLRELTAKACAWFEAQLRTEDARDAVAYLKNRGMTGRDAKLFGLGWAPEHQDELKKTLGATDEQMLEAGLYARSENGLYPRFRRRIMFPIHDARGRPVGFGGRLIGEGKPKYLNSPETPLFDKGSLLYNFHRAAPVARKTGLLAVAEGYMDVVIPACRSGAAMTAALGTALGERHLALCWSVVDRPVICFDGDGPGARAAEKAAFVALPLLKPGKSLAFAALPDGADPDEYVREHGGEAFADFLRGSSEPLDSVIRRILFARFPEKTPEELAARKKAVEETCAMIRDSEIRSGYRNALLEAHYRDARGSAEPQAAASVYEEREREPRRPSFRQGRESAARHAAASVMVRVPEAALAQNEDGFLMRMAGLLAAFPELLQDEQVNADVEACASDFLDEVVTLAVQSNTYDDGVAYIVSGLRSSGYGERAERLVSQARFFKNFGQAEARAAWNVSAGQRYKCALEKEVSLLMSDLTPDKYQKAMLLRKEMEAVDVRMKEASG